ncbi:CLUMA_CG019030, isoform A [Clunio marinus]|uniref:CLUMA_CG019030, isoform A n=1 Tax=Clunio marinus TaxID=568069 RepID=A0A1J1J042_9DIPT|nr:CLUMA_CG019030, isoform A [Clunio marinus]
MSLDSMILNFLKRELEQDISKTLFVFCCALVLIILAQYLIKVIIENLRLPPGPYGIFPFGILKLIGAEKHKSFMKLAATYGPLFSCKLGQQLHIVISDYKLIREIFKKESLTGRPRTLLCSELNGIGFINTDGKLWKDQRRFLHEKLRRFGMTLVGSKNTKLQNLITNEVDDLISNLSNETSHTVDLDPFFAVSVSNVICNLLMSVRFTRDDPKFIKFNRMIDEGMILFGQIYTIDYFPVTQYLPGMKSARNQIAENRREMFSFYKEVIEDHKKNFDSNNIRDLVDAYLMEIETAKLNNSEHELFEGNKHEEQIMQVIGDLFSAGMETIKTTLLWLIVYMLRNPDARKQVQDELDDVVGRNRMPKVSDLPFCPKTESTILEVMRMSSIVPLATTHSPMIDEEINGYKIPAGCHVIPLINSVHMDPTLWDKPEEFRPSRFLNAEGKVEKPEYFIPFGVGRRMCLGDVLARIESFLFFSSMMHRFDISLPTGAELPSLNGNPGVTIYPNKFSVCLKERELEALSDELAPLRAFGAN